MNSLDSTSIVVARTPADMLAFITQIDRLSAWNDLIDGIVARPSELHPGDVRKVALVAGPIRWVSRSAVVEHVPTRWSLPVGCGGPHRRRRLTPQDSLSSPPRLDLRPPSRSHHPLSHQEPTR